MIKQRSSIHWEDIRRRLQDGACSLQQAQRPDEDRLKSVYRERAVLWAGQETAALTPAMTIPVLVFQLGPERYAIELTMVTEVGRLPRCTTVPGGPPELCGVINHRGEVKPVMDLARLLNLAKSGTTTEPCFLVVRSEAGELCLRVDRVKGVEQFSEEELIPPDAAGIGAMARFVQGVHRDGVILLRGRKIPRLTTANETPKKALL